MNAHGRTLLILLLYTTACSSHSATADRVEQAPPTVARAAAPARIPAVSRALPLTRQARFSGAEGESATGLALPGAGAIAGTDTAGAVRMRIVSGRASLEVDSVVPAALRLRDLTTRLGGFVAGSSTETGSDLVRSADYELRVPAVRFQQVLDGFVRIGRLATLEVTSQDVGEEYVDVDARLRNANRLERRLLDLLASQTGRLRDVLEIEHALASVRGDIERLEGRIRYLRHSVELSTIVVTLREPRAAVAGAPGAVALTGAFRHAWDNFLWLATFSIQALGVIIPLALVAVAAWAARRRLRANAAPRSAVP